MAERRDEPLVPAGPDPHRDLRVRAAIAGAVGVVLFVVGAWVVGRSLAAGTSLVLLGVPLLMVSRNVNSRWRRLRGPSGDPAARPPRRAFGAAAGGFGSLGGIIVGELTNGPLWVWVLVATLGAASISLADRPSRRPAPVH